MDNYSHLAKTRILSDLKFSDQQLDLVGRILTLEREENLFGKVKFRYSNITTDIGFILALKDNREIRIEVPFKTSNGKYNSAEHGEIMFKIKKSLANVGVDSSLLNQFFSYSTLSYGLPETHGLDIHFGLDKI